MLKRLTSLFSIATIAALAIVSLPASPAWAATVAFSRTNIVIQGGYNQAQFTSTFSGFSAPSPQNIAELHIYGGAFRSSYQGPITAQTTPTECGNTGIYVSFAAGSPSIGTPQRCGITDWSFDHANIIVITNPGDSVTFTFSPGSVFFTSTAPTSGYVAKYITNINSTRGNDVLLTLDTQRTVTFNANGGSGNMSAQTASTPTALSPNVFSRTGYTFGNWNTLANNQGVNFSDGAVYPFTQTQTLFAEWTPNSYAVTYDSQGGSLVPPASYLTNSSVLLAPAPIKTGSQFAGWFTTPTGGTAVGNPYTPGGTGAITLYAQWTPNVTPGVSPTAIVRPSGQTNTFPFLIRGQASSGTGFLTADLIGLSSPGITLTTLTASSSGSACASSGITVYFLPGSPSLTGPSTAECHVFNVGAYAQVKIGVLSGDQVEIAVGTGALSFTSSPPASSGNTYRVETTVAGSGGTFISPLTNTWELVTFNSNNGQQLSTYEYAQQPNPLDANTFSLTGYSFNGWNTQENGSGTPYSNLQSYNFTSNLTLYAQWSPNSYTVTYDTQGGESVSSSSFLANGSVVLPPAPSKSDARFTGWFAGPIGGAPLPETYFPGTFSDVTIYAHWESLAKTGINIEPLILWGSISSLLGCIVFFARRRLLKI